MTDRNNNFKFVLLLILVLIITVAAYWYFLGFGTSNPNTPPDQNPSSGFNPLGRPSTNIGNGGVVGNKDDQVATTTPPQTPIPALRLLSNTPVGGYGASTTASTTVIRWVDRGRGNIFEAKGNTLDITTLSNTVVPKIYDSVWGKNLSAFIASTFFDDANSSGSIYAELKARVTPITSSTTATSTPNAAVAIESLTPYELRGKNLPENMVGYAVSPKKDKLFMFINEEGVGVGYISSFDGKNVTQLFTTPLTQVNIEWPTDGIIAITTKASANERGFLYFVDSKTGVWRKILGPFPGLSTKVSKDGKYVLASMAGNSQNVVTSILNVEKGTNIDAVIKTIADKCAWGNFYKEIVYCGVPSQIARAVYPDDWYKGTLSTIDQLWQVSAVTGEVNVISKIVDTSDRVIDAFNLGLDDKDDFLIFMNKNDLSLWSLDLVSN